MDEVEFIFPCGPKKVEPYGFTIDTADGKKTYLSGGYFPLMMDRRTVRGRTISAEEELGEKIRKAYHTDRGAMMKRTGAVYPVSLEFTDLAREVDQSIHDICFRELVNDYNRLMRKRLFAEYLRLCAGKNDFDKIGEYIDFLAGGTREYNRITGMDGIVNWLRKGFTISTLTLNAGVIVQNLSNPFTLENVVDGFGKAEVFKTVLYAAKMMPCVLAGTKEGREFKEFVYSKSQMMKDREQTNDIIFEQVREYDTLEGGNILEKNNNRLMDFSNWIFNASDNITMLPAWYVAYEQGINELKLSENKAVLRADDVVKKTVGSGRKYDVSSIQRNKQVLARMITPFMTFFNKELNKVIRETYRDYHKKEFGRMAWFYFQKFVLFAALSELLALRPPEEDEPWWKWMLESGVSFAAGLTPFTRELPSLDRVNFFTLVMNLILDGKIKAYEYRLDGNELFTPDNELDVENMLDKFYIYYTKDDKGKYKIEPTDMPCPEKYYIKESNYLDQLSNFQTRVTAVCPVLMQSDFGDSEKPTAYPMFWLNYDEISPYLGQTQVMTSSYNNTSNMSLDDYFVMRQYDGDIYKTSNLRNMPLSEYCETDSALQVERARIEKQLIDFQNGLWNDVDLEPKVSKQTAPADEKKTKEAKEPKPKKEKAPKAPRQSASGGERISVHR